MVSKQSTASRGQKDTEKKTKNVNEFYFVIRWSYNLRQMCPYKLVRAHHSCVASASLRHLQDEERCVYDRHRCDIVSCDHKTYF